MKTVVLAYSGGLDTSVCIPLLKERYDYDRVITVVADVGQPASEIDDATKRAKTLADGHYTLDLKDEFVDDYLFPSIKANGRYEGYVLGTALARPLIAKKIADFAPAAEGEALVGQVDDRAVRVRVDCGVLHRLLVIPIERGNPDVRRVADPQGRSSAKFVRPSRWGE